MRTADTLYNAFPLELTDDISDCFNLLNAAFLSNRSLLYLHYTAIIENAAIKAHSDFQFVWCQSAVKNTVIQSEIRLHKSVISLIEIKKAVSMNSLKAVRSARTVICNLDYNLQSN